MVDDGRCKWSHKPLKWRLDYGNMELPLHKNSANLLLYNCVPTKKSCSGIRDWYSGLSKNHGAGFAYGNWPIDMSKDESLLKVFQAATKCYMIKYVSNPHWFESWAAKHTIHVNMLTAFDQSCGFFLGICQWWYPQVTGAFSGQLWDGFSGAQHLWMPKYVLD